MNEFVEIKIEVKAVDGDSYIISNDDGIRSIIERDDDPYHIYNTIKRQLANKHKEVSRNCRLTELKEVYNDILYKNKDLLSHVERVGWGRAEILNFFNVLIKTLESKQ